MKALAGDFNQDFHDYKPLWMDLRFKLYSSLVCRISLYLAGLLYSFIGVFIVADIFMCSIDSITSTTKKVTVSGPNGEQVDENCRMYLSLIFTKYQ